MIFYFMRLYYNGILYIILASSLDKHDFHVLLLFIPDTDVHIASWIYHCVHVGRFDQWFHYWCRLSRVDESSQEHFQRQTEEL